MRNINLIPKKKKRKKIHSDTGFYKRIPPISPEEEKYYENFFKGPKDKDKVQKGTPVKGKPGLTNL